MCSSQRFFKAPILAVEHESASLAGLQQEMEHVSCTVHPVKSASEAKACSSVWCCEESTNLRDRVTDKCKQSACQYLIRKCGCILFNKLKRYNCLPDVTCSTCIRAQSPTLNLPKGLKNFYL